MVEYLFDKKTLNTRQARWLACLSEYDFEIKHIKEKENIVADALSLHHHTMHLVLISDYESKLKALLKEASNNDGQYKTWEEKCNKEIFGIEECLYRIDTEGFIHFKN